MTLYLTQEQFDQLLANGHDHQKDHKPVVKIEVPGKHIGWLLTEIENTQTLLAYGLYHHGDYKPALGYLDLREIESALESAGLVAVTDYEFEPQYPLSTYAQAAKMTNYLCTSEKGMLREAHKIALKASKPTQLKLF